MIFMWGWARSVLPVCLDRNDHNLGGFVTILAVQATRGVATPANRTRKSRSDKILVRGGTETGCELTSSAPPTAGERHGVSLPSGDPSLRDCPATLFT